MFSQVLFAASAALLLASANAEGLYSKGSAVLQVNGKSYDKLIAKSNQVSILEFYAPWCGHCKNLKPEYEKAAKGLKDLAQVAAINCDEESNKAFCGSMGVQGFPTLKIVKPSKKPGRPIVDDYQGGRQSKDIVDFVKAAIPNNVKKITDKGLSAWLDSSNDTSKAILFSNKGTTGALVKVLANEYLASLNFAQIRDKERAAVDMFGVSEYPTLVVLPGGTQEPVKYDGQFSKDGMIDFLGQYASSSAQASPKTQKSTSKEPEKAANSEEAASSFSKASTSHASAEASEEAARATSVTLEDESNPTESPNPIVTPEEKPIQVPNLPEPIPALIEQKFLQEKCLGEKTSTCVLALLPTTDDEEGILAGPASSGLASLAELAEKHVERGSKLFPFYSIPARNSGAASLRDALKLGGDNQFELVAVNGRRGWWRRYEGEKFDIHSVENWIDNIRFGEGQKGALPENLIVKAEEQPAAPTHGEL